MKKELLFIDDNPMMGGFLSHLFGKAFEVKWCSTAEDALSSLQDNYSPDLIICDYELSGINGYEFLQNVKSSGLHKDIPVLMLSGKGTSENRIKCLKEGAEDFILKPFNPTELNLKVINVLKKQEFSTIK